jgi:hypothetical protein
VKKLFLALSLGIGLSLGAAALPAASPESVEAAPGLDKALEKPPFYLETETGDSPALAKKKAALRLFKEYNVTLNRLNICKARHPEADKAGAGFGSRNGATLNTVILVIRQTGGLSPDIREVLNERIALESAAESPACPDLIQAVSQGRRDLYKASEYAADYRLVRGR